MTQMEKLILTIYFLFPGFFNPGNQAPDIRNYQLWWPLKKAVLRNLLRWNGRDPQATLETAAYSEMSWKLFTSSQRFTVCEQRKTCQEPELKVLECAWNISKASISHKGTLFCWGWTSGLTWFDHQSSFALQSLPKRSRVLVNLLKSEWTCKKPVWSISRSL